jgi:tetratricopeptide (TPR) repeat protein
MTTAPGVPAATEATLAACLQEYDRDPSTMALETLLAALEGAPEAAWLECGRTLGLRNHVDAAARLFERAVSRHPASGELLLGLAGTCWRLRRHDDAERLLRDWLSRHPADVAAGFLLGRVLFDLGRAKAAAAIISALFQHGEQGVDVVIQAVEMLDDFGRPLEALQVCESALGDERDDPRLHAYAGMLAIQLGRFPEARRHHEFALAHAAEAVEWNVPLGLSELQRYRDPAHPDLALFRSLLARADLSDQARTATLFALGKACDDLGDHAQAARCFIDANARARTRATWSRKQWTRLVRARLAAPPFEWSLSPPAWVPVFIVGVPRSGTTVLAELLSRHPQVCNRGELGWLQRMATQLADAPRERRELFEQAAAAYAAHLLQDDSDAGWFIDKQPLNLLHVDLIMALWPNARIVHCRRGPRDVALSLWSQSFHDRAHEYACDFADIAAVLRGGEELMRHWSQRFPDSIRTVDYEDLVSDPQRLIADLRHWLGLPAADAVPLAEAGDHAIRTASAWQARQPIHTGSVGRWQHYASSVPELLKFPLR